MLTDKQKIAFFLQRNGEKVTTTALACEVHRCTIWRWFQKREFWRRYKLYCEYDFQRTVGSPRLMEIWHKYEADRDALLRAIRSGDRVAINQMYSYIIREYYETIEGKIEAKLAQQQKNRS